MKSEPHAYVKLWKHHAAQPEANKITEIAEQRGEVFLNRYGGKISSEWMEPKVLQILNEAPEIYDRAEKIMEVGDWVNYMLTAAVLEREAAAAREQALGEQRDFYESVRIVMEGSRHFMVRYHDLILEMAEQEADPRYAERFHPPWISLCACSFCNWERHRAILLAHTADLSVFHVFCGEKRFLINTAAAHI